MNADTQAQLLYATVGAALDCGAKLEQIKRLFRAKNIEFVAEMIAKKAGTADQGGEKR